MKTKPCSLAVFLLFCAVVPAGMVAQITRDNRPLPTLRPFTAEFSTKTVQKLADGTTITRESKEVMARDSGSRFMSSNTRTPLQAEGEPHTTTHVEDPVAGTRSDWDSHTRKATVIKLPPREERHGCWADETGGFRMSWSDALGEDRASRAAAVSSTPEPKRDDLGTMMIQGVEAHGWRYTRTIPVGEAGNDQPLVNTQEVWTAPELGQVVRSIRDDPRTGTTTRELTSLTLGEPDPALFQPPDGYEVRNREMHAVACP